MNVDERQPQAGGDEKLVDFHRVFNKRLKKSLICPKNSTTVAAAFLPLNMAFSNFNYADIPATPILLSWPTIDDILCRILNDTIAAVKLFFKIFYASMFRGCR